MGREGHCKQTSLACVGSACTVSAPLGLPPLRACVLSLSTLLRLQVVLRGNYLKWALGCVHFPGLRHLGSGSRVLHKGTDSVGLAFCALTGPSSSGDQVAWLALSPQVCGASYHIPIPAARCPGCAAGISAGVPCVSSGELISGCDTPGGCQLSRSPGRLG